MCSFWPYRNKALLAKCPPTKLPLPPPLLPLMRLMPLLWLVVLYLALLELVLKCGCCCLMLLQMLLLPLLPVVLWGCMGHIAPRPPYK